MLNEPSFLEEEFLVRFQIVNAMQNPLSKRKFFKYANDNLSLIDANKNKPMIIDFYYQYYFYLLEVNQRNEAKMILNELYAKQKEYQAFIYSPLVEIELAKQAKLENKYESALEYLQQSLENTRKIKNNEAAEVYYEMIKLYELTNNQTLYNETLQKCKALDATTTSLYKKMCDEM
jgi:hypothetical protein